MLPGAVLALAQLASPAGAQTTAPAYPNKPIRFVVPRPAARPTSSRAASA